MAESIQETGVGANASALMGVTKVKQVIKLVCPFIRDKGDGRKSEICNLRDGSELYANK